MARVIPQDGNMVREWEVGNGGHVYEIRFLIPDWREGQEVSVELGSSTTRVVQCWGVPPDYYYEMPGTLRFRLGTPRDGNDANVVGCQMEGTFEDAIISYHGTFCFVSPPPPPHLYAACDRLTAEGFQFRMLANAGTGWRGAVHINNWQPGTILRMDFGGVPFQVNEVTYAERGVRAATVHRRPPAPLAPACAPVRTPPGVAPSLTHAENTNPADVH